MRSDIKLDCYGLLCPMPIIQTSEKMKQMAVGQVLEIVATDEGIVTDMPAWSKMTGQEFLGCEEVKDEYHCFVKKVK